MPVSSSFTGATSGQLRHRLHDGLRHGERLRGRRDERPAYLVKPATYPAFLARGLLAADARHQFGTWGDVNDIIVVINADCATPARHSTWGTIKTMYR